ncbi:sensor histidine kinase [Streptococcus ovis]|uniref:sensor histidine kinase n=1 Tax=Streptococcus ovis TaxID=82806 RepID=UPI0003700535|nr:histidine kinase [Streptococcus ovis]
MSVLKKFKELKTNQSIDFLSKSLAFVLIIIFIVNCTLSYFYIANIKKQNLAQIEDTLNIFTRSLHQDLVAEERFMYWTILHDETLDNLVNSNHYGHNLENLQKIRSRVQEFESYNNVDFSLFVQDQLTKELTNISTFHMPYAEFLLLEEIFKQPRDYTATTYDTWNTLTIEGKHYLYKVITYNEKTIYSVASTEAILKPLQEMEIGENGQISITAPAENFQSNSTLSNTNVIIAKKSRTQLPFNIYVSVDYHDAFRDVLILQFSILLLPFAISFIAFGTLLYIQRRVISPTKRLLQHLQGMSPEEIKFNKEGIIEIDDANTQINHLFTEIQVLKHDVFNAKLKQKSIEMNHLKNQIRPHFYLNILSMIHSMVQTQHYQEIEQLTLSTSRYFRYLFQTNQDFVSLEDEIHHIEDYLQVQHLRYGDSFSFQLNIEPEAHILHIPPLILQTFVENIFKHCFSIDTNLSIHLSVDIASGEKDYYRIILEDNGPGFPQDILYKLKSRTSLITKDGKHIGLTNTYERLDSLYQQNYYLQFLNKPTGGAMIKLILPSQIPKGKLHESLTR